MTPSCEDSSVTIRAYLAAPLFSDAERAFNAHVAHRLTELLQVYLPQRDGHLMSEMISAGVPAVVAASEVFQRDIEAIQRCTYLIAVLDGRAIDEGVAFELGVAYSGGKRCVGLQTDVRRLAPWGNNPMLSGPLEAVFSTLDDLVTWLSADVRAGTRRVEQS